MKKQQQHMSMNAEAELKIVEKELQEFRDFFEKMFFSFMSIIVYILPIFHRDQELAPVFQPRFIGT